MVTVALPPNSVSEPLDKAESWDHGTRLKLRGRSLLGTQKPTVGRDRSATQIPLGGSSYFSLPADLF